MNTTTFDPWLKSPLTDLTCDINSQQYFGRCADDEMKMVDCLEAYGLGRGLQKCDDLIHDFKECVTRKKQMNRILAMRKERTRQWLTGERSYGSRFAPGPVPDSYPASV